MERRRRLLFLLLALFGLTALNQLSAQGPGFLFVVRTDFAAGDSPISAGLGDFNGDSVQDLAVANGDSDSVSIMLGNGDGTFGVSQNFAVGLRPVSIVPGDFNGDSVQDLGVANRNSDNISILLGNGDGSFATVQNFAVGSQPESVVAGDFNGDSVQDLGVANRGSDNVSILLGNGNGSFATAQDFAVGSQPRSIAAGDFNGDSVLDLAVANSSSDDVSILLGNGDGSFGGAQSFFLEGSPRFVVIGDFDGDSVRDLAVASRSSDNISILLGNGNGNFGSAQSFVVGRIPLALAVGDLNGDSVQDLAVVNRRSNNVSILLGKGNGSFAVPQNLGVGESPISIVLGDFNGDSRQDLAVANQASDNVSILLQIRPPGVFAMFANGESGGLSNKTRIIVRNNGDVTADGALRFKDDTGNSIQVAIDGISQSQIEFSLDPFYTLDLETDGTGLFQTGVIEIVQDNGNPEKLAGTIIFDLLGNFVSVDQTPIRLKHQGYVSVVPGPTGESTGVAAYNPHPDQTATLEFVLLDDFAMERATLEVTLGPMQQLVGFVDRERLFQSFFEENPPPFKGTLNIRVTDGPAVAILGLIQKTADGALIAVSTSPDAFMPLDGSEN